MGVTIVIEIATWFVCSPSTSRYLSKHSDQC